MIGNAVCLSWMIDKIICPSYFPKYDRQRHLSLKVIDKIICPSYFPEYDRQRRLSLKVIDKIICPSYFVKYEQQRRLLLTYEQQNRLLPIFSQIWTAKFRGKLENQHAGSPETWGYPPEIAAFSRTAPGSGEDRPKERSPRPAPRKPLARPVSARHRLLPARRPLPRLPIRPVRHAA